MYGTLINGLPVAEFNKQQDEWDAKMAIRLPVEQFDMRKLVNKLLTQHWQHECEIGNLIWTHDGTDGGKRVSIRYGDSYLRYSRGPGTGTFWDSSPDDFHSPELALVELSKAYPPPNVGVVIPTHGK